MRDKKKREIKNYKKRQKPPNKYIIEVLTSKKDILVFYLEYLFIELLKQRPGNQIIFLSNDPFTRKIIHTVGDLFCMPTKSDHLYLDGKEWKMDLKEKRRVVVTKTNESRYPDPPLRHIWLDLHPRVRLHKHQFLPFESVGYLHPKSLRKHLNRKLEQVPFYMQLFKLPDDLIIYLLTFLPIPDIISTSCTCKHLYKLASDNAIWYSLCKERRIYKAFTDVKFWKRFFVENFGLKTTETTATGLICTLEEHANFPIHVHPKIEYPPITLYEELWIKS